VLHQPKAGIGQPEPAPDAFRQRNARLALELGQLLADGARRVGHRLGDRRDRSAGVQLAEEDELPEVEQR
jgi:hypothetical protein